MLDFRQFGVGCHVNIAVKLVRGFHFHRVTTLNKVDRDVLQPFLVTHNKIN